MVAGSTVRAATKWMASAALDCLFRATALAVSVTAVTAIESQPSQAQDNGSDAPITFDIPAQPLARALVAYSSATGLELVYKAALAERQQSREVIGTLSPSTALQELLRGTGYIAKKTGPGFFTILPANPETGAESEARRRLYEPYFAVIQSRISGVVCGEGGPSPLDETLLRAWLSATGIIARAEILRDDGRRAADQTFAATLRGMAIGIPPPSGMPQPVNIVIFPATKTSKRCGTGGRFRRAGP